MGSTLSPGFLLPAFLSAFFLVLAQPPFDTLPLPFLALVPLFVALGSLPSGARGRWRASLLAGVFGLCFWGYSLLWVPLEVGPSFFWAIPGFGLLLVILGGLSALFGWTAHRLHRGAGLPLALAVSLAWVGVEWIRAHFPFGLDFPWLGLGVTLSGWPGLLGPAEWVGERGVAFWLAGVNGLVATAVLEMGNGAGSGESPTSRRRFWLRAVVAAVVPAAFGLARSHVLPLEPGPRVVVVGTRVEKRLRQDPVASAREAVSQVAEALATLEPGSAELVLLPEATVFLPLDDRRAEPFLETLSGAADRLQIPMAFGALGKISFPGRVDALTNSAYLLLPHSSGLQRYDKARLVPGMETGGYVPGSPGGVLSGGGWTFGPLLCYESLFGDLARRQRLKGADILLHLTSDIWFGREESLLGSAFLHQHPAHLVLRAVENRISVARAANGGVSLFLGPTGRPLSPPLPPGGGLVAAQLPTMRGYTLFSRTGDLAGPVSVLLSLAFLLLGRRREVREQADSSA